MAAGQRLCEFVFPENSRRCQAPPLRHGKFCRVHEPALAAEVQQGRSLGGQRSRKETVLAGAYDVGELRTVEELRRLLVIAQYNALALENSVQAVRALTGIVHEGAILLRDHETAEAIKVLNQAVLGQQGELASPFDADLAQPPFPGEAGSNG